MNIFCDFDGTISTRDSTDLVLRRLAPPQWEEVENDWVSGKIDAAACMRLQLAMLDAPLSAIDAVLDEVELSDGFAEFVAWARAEQLQLTVVSDGVDYFIRYILSRNGFTDLPVIANHLVPREGGGYELLQPHQRAACDGGSGVCKCAIVGAIPDRRTTVYIGDGRSDFCVSARPDLLFATNALADHCSANLIAYQPFTDFHDVFRALQDCGMTPRAAMAA